MKYRIAMWAGIGFLVAGFWALYFFLTAPAMTSIEPIWTLARITCPIVFASFYFHFPLGIVHVFFANAATYALFGLMVESFRQNSKSPTTLPG